MNPRFALGLGIALLTLLTWIRFPGHTWLTQDTQIYAPILEHLWNPSVLANDLLVQRPHVSFTLYDEMAIALRWVSRASFHTVLMAEQIVFRGLGIWGVYMIAQSILRNRVQAFLASAIFSLGAEVAGPAVLVTEYEPSPRAFAIPLLFLSLGLVAQGRFIWAGCAGSLAFLFHAPSSFPFWLVALVYAVAVRRSRMMFLPLAGAAVILAVAARLQAGATEPQFLFGRIGPDLEAIQRMRASYNWVSMWWREQAVNYTSLYLLALGGTWRLYRMLSPVTRMALLALPALGMLSVPVSALLLDRVKWSLMPQLQPARALLFVTALAQLCSVLCAIADARERRWATALIWFAAAFLLPLHDRMDKLPRADHLLAAAVCSVAGAAAIGFRSRTATLALAFAAPVALPLIAHARNYPTIETPELRDLSTWAADHTTPGAVFVFPHSDGSLEPGLFRDLALRAIYADWKGGGQVNYLKDFAAEWWNRYRAVVIPPFTADSLRAYRERGIDYAVVPASTAVSRDPVFRNGKYAVFRTAS